MATKPMIAQCMTVLAEYFDRKLSDTLTKIYHDALQDLTDDQLEAATSAAIHTLKFFPKVHELRELAGQGTPTPQEQAMLAWNEAWAKVSSHGAYATVVFQDPVIVAVIQAMGGWAQFCRPVQEDKWHRKEFIDLYAAHYHRRDTLRETTLLGIHDADNLQRGYLQYVSPEGRKRISGESLRPLLEPDTHPHLKLAPPPEPEE